VSKACGRYVSLLTAHIDALLLILHTARSWLLELNIRTSSKLPFMTGLSTQEVHGHIGWASISGTFYILILLCCRGAQVLTTCYSIWFEELQQVKAFRPTAATGQNTVLQQFFWRLVHLLSLPVAAFFVFDGADRPDYKRDKHVCKVAHWMQNAAQYLIEAFGFQYSTVSRLCIYIYIYIYRLSQTQCHTHVGPWGS
jgi:hypothetical protein